MDKRRRLLFAGIVLLAALECLWFLFAATVEWNLRGLMLKPGDPQIALNARTAIADLTWAVLNVVASFSSHNDVSLAVNSQGSR